MTKYCAIICENRFDVTEVIADHKKFLPSYFDVLHIKDEKIKTEYDYNALMTSLEFWENLPYDKVLIFQHDSRLLRFGIEFFYEWDYVGAPWTFQNHGGNGGLSLRSVSAMIEVIKTVPYVRSYQNEDVYFSNILKEMKHLKLAPRHICEMFSCEAIFATGTLGTHAIDKYLTPEQCEIIYNQYNQ